MAAKKVIDIYPPQKEIKSERELPLKTEIRAPRNFKFPKRGLIFCLFFFIALAIFCYFTLVEAEINLWLGTEISALQLKITADQEAREVSVLENVIPARILQKEKTVTESFQSSGQILKETKAEGTIRVYNDYSTSPQVLVATTRFVSADGKVFRTPIAVTVPGGKYEEGKFVSGEIDIKVIADQPGLAYNIGPSTFSIPGFAGTDRYTKFYAKSFQTMQGGSQEEAFKVTKEDLAQAETLLTNQAKKECQELLLGEIQSVGLYANSDYSSDFPTEIIEKFSLNSPGEEIAEFKFQVKANCQALVFYEQDLEDFALAALAFQVLQGKKVFQESLQIKHSSESVDLSAGQMLVSLDFSAKIYSEIDAYSLTRAVLGKSLFEAKFLLESQPEIRKAVISFWPFWVKKVPEDSNKVKVNINID